MKSVFTSWKTTLGGWLGASLLIATEYLTTKKVTVPTVVTALSIAGIGTAAKDSGVQ